MTEEQNKENNDNAQVKKNKKHKMWNVMKKNPLTAFLLIVLVVFIGWSTIKMSIDKNQFKKDKIELIAKYESKIDSIKIKNIEFSSKVFSWSVRSELLRQNLENLNQLFTVFVKESDADLVQLVDMKDNKIIISTDKQFEGKIFKLAMSMNLNKQTTVRTDLKTTIYTPIMGFNNNIGLLIVNISK